MAYNELSVLANTSRQIVKRINQDPANWRFIVKTANLNAGSVKSLRVTPSNASMPNRLSSKNLQSKLRFEQ